MLPYWKFIGSISIYLKKQSIFELSITRIRYELIVHFLEKKKELGLIKIDKEATLLQCIQYMDKINRKLLIVTENNRYHSIISIGDIQRAILNNKKLDTPVQSILRKHINVGKVEDSRKEVIQRMLELRTEFMPILDDSNNLVDVIFWEEIFKEKKDINKIEEEIKVVIMAGGKGSRLKPITNIIPKPLVPIGNRAFIEIIMDSFHEYGLSEFLLSVNYKSDLIKHYFDNSDKPYSVEYFKESKPLGTAGSITLMKDKLKDTFFISNCDIIIDQDYSEIYNYHKQNKNELTAVAAIKTYHIPYGTMSIGSNGMLKSLNEKPSNSYYVNAGLYLLEPHLLEDIPEGEFFHITHLMEKILARGGKVGVFPVSEGAWMDIGEWNNYNETQQKFNTRFELSE